MAPIKELTDKFQQLFSKKDKSSSPDAPSTDTPAASEQPKSQDTSVAGPAATAESKKEAEADAGKELDSLEPFDQKEIKVIFVLGGPGAGKGTQCAKLVEDFQFAHLSAGDLLRAEQNREGSTYGAMIKENIKNGTIVPMEVTIKLLRNAMEENIAQGKKRFLIDGFPRKMDQAIKFEEKVCVSSLILFLTCPEDVLLQRLLKRGETSGRDDDNAESIKKRFRTFIETSMPVVDYYRAKGKVVEIQSTKSVEEVYADIKKNVVPLLEKDSSAPAAN